MDLVFAEYDTRGLTAFAFPHVVMLDRETAVVSDRTGWLRQLDIAAGRIRSQLFVGCTDVLGVCILPTCIELDSLCIDPASHGSCAVATRGGYAAVWRIGADTFQRLTPLEGGSVNAVAYSAGGGFIALGLGFYPLADRRPARAEQAAIEVWAVDEDPSECHGRYALPGVCVDGIAWAPESDHIWCATGVRSQRGGLLMKLVPGTLRPVIFEELPFAMVRTLIYAQDQSGNDFLVIAHRCGAAAFSTDGLLLWYVETPECVDKSVGITDLAYSPETDQVLLSNGLIVSGREGREIWRLPPLAGCTSVAVRPGGGYVGVSQSGVLRCWD